MLNKLKKILPQNQFAKGVSILVGGTAISQIIMILTSPLLTRLYTPEDFGLLAVYAGLLSIFTVISSLRYELAIPLPKTNQDAAHITILSLLIVCIITAISSFLVFFLGNEISNLLGAPKLSTHIWLLPLGIFLIGSYQVLNYWAIRTKSFAIIAKTKVRQSLITSLIQFLGFKLGSVALIVGQTTGQGAGCFSILKAALKHPEFKKWEWKDLWTNAKRYKNFPLYSTWSGLLNTLGNQLPIIFLSVFFSTSAVGLYALAHKVLSLPISLLGNAIGQVFFSNGAIAHRDGTLLQLITSVYMKLLIIAAPLMVFLMGTSENLFEFAFGESWRSAGEMAKYLAPWLCLSLITSPLSVLFSILEKQRLGIIFHGSMLLARGIVLYTAYLFNDLPLAIISYSFVSSVFWLAFLLWAIKYNKGSLSIIIKPLLYILALSLLLSTPIFYVNNASLGMINTLGIYLINFIILFIFTIFTYKKIK